jgi:hypothetical protein
MYKRAHWGRLSDIRTLLGITLYCEDNEIQYSLKRTVDLIASMRYCRWLWRGDGIMADSSGLKSLRYAKSSWRSGFVVRRRQREPTRPCTKFSCRSWAWYSHSDRQHTQSRHIVTIADACDWLPIAMSGGFQALDAKRQPSSEARLAGRDSAIRWCWWVGQRTVWANTEDAQPISTRRPCLVETVCGRFFGFGGCVSRPVGK